jgi:RNA polymerase sigma-70 factor (ECF subfamily)
MTATHSNLRERFGQMLSECEGLLLGHARRLVRGDDERAQDLVQEALVRGYEAMLAGKFRDGFRPCAWLARILTNFFINEWRRSRKWDAGVTVETLTAGGESGPLATRMPGADAVLFEGTFDETLERALDALPESLRITILLVDVHDYSYVEAAQSLDVPIGTVRSRLSRGRFLLARALDGVAETKGWAR